MAEIRISEEARVDLENIRTIGVERFGETAAERHLGDIRQVFELLSDHPRAGQERPEFRQDIRAIACRPHRILYSAGSDGVLIVRVVHQARDVAAALDDPS